MAAVSQGGPVPVGAHPSTGRPRSLRAAGVAVAWALVALPTALGWQRCALAVLFHVPCPGCGMSRALRLLVSGHPGASLRMHPLTVPVLVAALLLMTATVRTTFASGSPFLVHHTRLGRLAIGAAIVVYAAMFALWVLRYCGCFGGPVPVG
jgi:hypothetical protein